MALRWERSGSSGIHGNVTKTTRLPNKASIFRAEIHAISLALSLIRHSEEKNFIIFSDYLSSLEAISGFKLEIDIVQNIIKDYTHLANSDKTIILCWIPSHVNIRGNERADIAAKSALSLPITNMKLPERELIPCVSKFCFDEIYGTVAREINFILFTPRLSLLSIAKIFPATIPSCSTDCELVILVSLTHTY